MRYAAQAPCRVTEYIERDRRTPPPEFRRGDRPEDLSMSADPALISAHLAERTPEEEIRELITDLRDAAHDGRRLARRYAELLEKIVDEYCVEFEQRAEAALARLNSQ
jgi:hypothetical protein